MAVPQGLRAEMVQLSELGYHAMLRAGTERAALMMLAMWERWETTTYGKVFRTFAGNVKMWKEVQHQVRMASWQAAEASSTQVVHS